MRLKANSTQQKLRGAYYTPQKLAEVIVQDFCDGSHARILEPSSGDGVFIEALDRVGYLKKDTHLTAVEIDEAPLVKSASQYSMRSNIEFHQADFFEFYKHCKPGDYDLIIGNPPYIRYQYLKSEQRQMLSDLLLNQGMKSNKLINAWVGFMVACTNLLSDNGQLMFVVPAEILQVVYAEDLRLFLETHYSEITIISFNKLIFDDIEQEVLVFVGRKGTKEGLIRVIQADDIAHLNSLCIEKAKYQPMSRVHEKWTKYFIPATEAKALSRIKENGKLVRFDSLAIINVGITTGNNRFFSLDEDTSKKYELNDFTLPLIGRSSHAAGVYYNLNDWEHNKQLGKRARLLVLEDKQYESLTHVQQSYIDQGETRGENEGYKCSIRNSWYSVPSVWVPDAFFLRRNNLYPKFVLNASGAVSTDTMHRIKFKTGVDPKLMVLAYYNSIGFAFTELCGRSYGGGVLEILPKEVGGMLLPKIENGMAERVDVDSLVNWVDEVIREGRNIEEALDRIDKEVLQAQLGFTKNDCDTCRRIWKILQSRRLKRGAQ